jgi:hypothetical protein
LAIAAAAEAQVDMIAVVPPWYRRYYPRVDLPRLLLAAGLLRAAGVWYLGR